MMTESDLGEVPKEKLSRIGGKLEEWYESWKSTVSGTQKRENGHQHQIRFRGQDWI